MKTSPPPRDFSAVEEVKAALALLSPRVPLLAHRDLSPRAAKSLHNSLAALAHGKVWLEPLDPVKGIGLGKGAHAHLSTRPDLIPFAQAEIAIRLADKLVQWYAFHFDARRLPFIPAAMRASVAARAVWSVGRILLQVDASRNLLTTEDARYAAVDALRSALLDIARPWLSVLPADVATSAFSADEYAFDRVAWDTGLAVRVTSMSSGSALVSDLRYHRVLESGLAPAATMTRVEHRLQQWLRSAVVSDRVLAVLLTKAGVALADEQRVCDEAARAYATESWAAAALALFPTPEALALTRTASPTCRTREILAWSAAHIDCALHTASAFDVAPERTRTSIRLTFDAATIRAVVVAMGTRAVPLSP